MQKINPILFVLLIGLFLSVNSSNAQHLLEYGNSKKVIKIVAERGGAIYYNNWPDTVDGITRAVLVADITSLKALTYEEVDSVFARLNQDAEQEQQNKTVEKLIKNQNRKLMSMELDVNTAIAGNRTDVGVGFGLGRKGDNGVEVLARVGYDYTNQGIGFIYTQQVPLSLQVYCNLMRQKLLKGIPFINVMGGYNFVLSGKFDTSRDRSEKYLDYTDDLLESNMFFGAGGGLTYNRVRFGLSYKLQGSNVKYPEIGYMHFVMVKLTMKLL